MGKEIENKNPLVEEENFESTYIKVKSTIALIGYVGECAGNAELDHAPMTRDAGWGLLYLTDVVSHALEHMTYQQIWPEIEELKSNLRELERQSASNSVCEG